MNDEMLTSAGSQEELTPSGNAAPTLQVERTGQRQTRPIVIAATFTTDLLRRPLQFWMDTLEIATEIELAPYAQLLQQLLDPRSSLSQNRSGFNIVLVRLEDWIRDLAVGTVADRIAHLRTATNEFLSALAIHRSRKPAPTLVFFCPPSTTLPEDLAASLADLQGHALDGLSRLADVHCWTHSQLMQFYPVVDHEDRRADRIGHIPYSDEYFVAVATLLARRVAVLLKPPCKVIAVDCDNTLWKGICGEDGAQGIDLTPAHLQLQRLLVRQHDAGVLLCLCSKNNPGDVDAVFSAHPDMPLQQEHFVCSRVNWSSKSSNLRSLADELGLALDSFVLIDDSAIECAGVRAQCPAVSTLQLPQTQRASHIFWITSGHSNGSASQRMRSGALRSTARIGRVPRSCDKRRTSSSFLPRYSFKSMPRRCRRLSCRAWRS